ncbi:RNA-binding protein spenito isoform X2 [Brevipalpus obovatus]|uniref:RNA-binding protein spenito isoform X2 n=1 Tax=Brevipalpus obovatus TaxID=246614 RepID=UPI003D9F6C21
MSRYDDSPRDRSPIESRRERGRIKSPSERRRGRDSSMNMSRSARDPYDDYPPPRMKSGRESAPYKILCISNLNHKFGDTAYRDALTREFSRFGDVSVRVCHDANERFAYIYFRSHDDAREARHAKSRLIVYDKAVEIEPIYDHHRSSVVTSSGASSARRRSVSPDYGPPMSRSRPPPGSSPPPSRSRPPPPPPPPPPSHMRNSSDKYGGGGGQSHSRQNQRTGNDMRSGNDYHHHHHQAGNQNRQTHRESKKEKFPNYLHHIPPEDDDKATRTLFVGNLEVTISEVDLRRLFERYGEVEDIDVKRPPPGQGNAYAFIKFLNLDMAHRAKVEMSGQYIGKFQCKIGYGKATPTTRIWVGGLGPWTSLSHLEREFDRFGSIRKIDFVKGDNHAYIQYDSIDAAQAACQEMRGHALGGPDKRLRVDFADPGPFSSNYNSPTRPSNSSTARYHGSDYGDNFSDKGNSRPRQPNNSGDNFVGNDGIDKREKSDYPGSGPSWNDWDTEYQSPSNDRRRRPRTPEVDVSERKKIRHNSMSPELGAERSPTSPRPSRVGGPDSTGKRSPSFEVAKSEPRRASIHENVKCFADFAKNCQAVWDGGLILKNSAFPAKMYLCSGDVSLVELMKDPSSDNQMVRITQRLRLDPSKLEDVSRRMNCAGGSYCMLYTTGTGLTANQFQAETGDDGRSVQTRPLKHLVTYLRQKEAAGVISLTNSSQVPIGMLYAFPSCPFALDLLKKAAPNLSEEGPKDEYLVVVVVRGGN